MARSLEFEHDGERFACTINKVDRSKLYGRVDIETLDLEGGRCSLATLANDGKTLIPYGGTAFGYVNPDGEWVTRGELKPVDHDFDTLVEAYGDATKLGQAIIDADPEVDIERFGFSLWNTSKVYIDVNEEVVYRVQQNEIVRGPSGKIKATRPRRRAEANVDGDTPLTWTGRMIPKADALRRFVFVSKLQIVHVNGLTYDFLFGMAKELADADSLMLLSGGASGKQPLVFRRGSTPYRGFLEGRIDGDRYILLLHLSNVEPKRKADAAAVDVDEDEEVAVDVDVDAKADADTTPA